MTARATPAVLRATPAGLGVTLAALAALAALVWSAAACRTLEAADAPGKPNATKPVAAQPVAAQPVAAALGKAAVNTSAPSNASASSNASAPSNAPAPGNASSPSNASAPAGAPAKGDDSEDIVELMGSNAACCVCHMTFLKESMAKSHLKAKVGCVKCHGASANHANDEHIGATKPDVVYRRNQIDPACVKCHEVHNAPAKDVIGRFVERKLPTSPQPTCTECHGMHRIDRAVDAQAKQ